MLAKRSVSSKNREGFGKKWKKTRMEKMPVSKKNKLWIQRADKT